MKETVSCNDRLSKIVYIFAYRLSNAINENMRFRYVVDILADNICLEVAKQKLTGKKLDTKNLILPCLENAIQRAISIAEEIDIEE